MSRVFIILGLCLLLPLSQPAYAETASAATGEKGYRVLGTWYYPLKTAKGFSETGMASWYGKRFHGGPTASGEKFDMNALTAAHTILPFNSIVTVTNIATGASVQVRINDRGPFTPDRVIDVSAAAAEKLDFQGKGAIKVRVEGPSLSKEEQKQQEQHYRFKGKDYYLLDSAQGYNEVGNAAWYSKRAHGVSTASGEKFDANALTAAHPILPFNSKVKVTNLETGDSVVVRINDRGAFGEDQLIEVSEAAAKRLNFSDQASIMVRVQGVE
jgi:rare lipoprotein A (peptidoglycan hydrolase)